MSSPIINKIQKNLLSKPPFPENSLQRAFSGVDESVAAAVLLGSLQQMIAQQRKKK